MSVLNEKNLAERLEEAESTIRDAIQWLKGNDQLDKEAEDAAKEAIQKVVILRRAVD